MTPSDAAERLTEHRVGGHKQKTAASVMVGDSRHPAAQRTDAVAFRQRAEIGGDQYRVQRQRIGIDLLAAAPIGKMRPGLLISGTAGVRDGGVGVARRLCEGFANRAVQEVLQLGQRGAAGDASRQGQRPLG